MSDLIEQAESPVVRSRQRAVQRAVSELQSRGYTMDQIRALGEEDRLSLAYTTEKNTPDGLVEQGAVTFDGETLSGYAVHDAGFGMAV